MNISGILFSIVPSSEENIFFIRKKNLHGLNRQQVNFDRINIHHVLNDVDHGRLNVEPGIFIVRHILFLVKHTLSIVRLGLMLLKHGLMMVRHDLLLMKHDLMNVRHGLMGEKSFFIQISHSNPQLPGHRLVKLRKLKLPFTPENNTLNL
jgi:hypothetical protein